MLYAWTRQITGDVQPTANCSDSTVWPRMTTYGGWVLLCYFLMSLSLQQRYVELLDIISWLNFRVRR